MQINGMTGKRDEAYRSLTKSVNLKLVAPFLSGASSVYLMDRVIGSDLGGGRFVLALCIVALLFLSSAALFYFLSKMEKEKDQSIITTIEQITSHVFAEYGTEAARCNTDRVPAKEMNEIMQTIVNVLAEMNVLGRKTYKG